MACCGRIADWYWHIMLTVLFVSGILSLHIGLLVTIIEKNVALILIEMAAILFFWINLWCNLLIPSLQSDSSCYKNFLIICTKYLDHSRKTFRHIFETEINKHLLKDCNKHDRTKDNNGKDKSENNNKKDKSENNNKKDKTINKNKKSKNDNTCRKSMEDGNDNESIEKENNNDKKNNDIETKTAFFSWNNFGPMIKVLLMYVQLWFATFHSIPTICYYIAGFVIGVVLKTANNTTTLNYFGQFVLHVQLVMFVSKSIVLLVCSMSLICKIGFVRWFIFNLTLPLVVAPVLVYPPMYFISCTIDNKQLPDLSQAEPFNIMIRILSRGQQ